MAIQMIVMAFVSPLIGGFIGRRISNLWLCVILLVISGPVQGVILSGMIYASGYSPDESAKFGIGMGLGVFLPVTILIGLFSRIKKRRKQDKVRSVENYLPPQVKESKSYFDADTIVQPEIHMKSNSEIMKEKGDEKFWAIADQEINSTPKNDLWIKCLYACGQDVAKAKVLYVHERVDQLKNEELHDIQALKKTIRKRGRKIFGMGFLSLFFLLLLLLSIFIAAIFSYRYSNKLEREDADLDFYQSVIKEEKWKEAVSHKRYSGFEKRIEYRGQTLTLRYSKTTDGSYVEPSTKDWIEHCQSRIEYNTNIKNNLQEELFWILTGSSFGIILFGWLTKLTFSKFRRIKKETV
jgi:hypothetical protein